MFATMIVGRWTNDAPSEAMAAVQRVQDPALRSALRAAVLRSWRDPDSLAAYLETLDPESPMRGARERCTSSSRAGGPAARG